MKTNGRTRAMVMEADSIQATSHAGVELLVIEHFGDDGRKRRVTVRLGGFGAEELAAKLSDLLKARRERMESLERHLSTAVEESKR